MKFSCTVQQIGGGSWRARHEGGDLGLVESRAETRERAIEKLKGELRYRLELCPCTGESYQHLEVEIIERDKA